MRHHVLYALCVSVYSSASAFASTTVYVLDGDPVPGGNGIFSQVQQTGPSINEAGEIAFTASLSSSPTTNSGVFLASGPSTITVLARKGSLAPDGTSFTDFNPTAAISASSAAFVAQSAGETNIIRHDQSLGNVVIARIDTPVPGGNGTFLAFETQPVLSATGRVAFATRIADTPGGATDDYGIFAGDGVSSLQTVAREGQTVPGGGVFASLQNTGYSDNVNINSAGDVSFRADVDTLNGTYHERIYRWSGFQLIEIGRGDNNGDGHDEGTPAPGFGGGMLGGLTVPSMNDLGQVAFISAVLNVPSDGSNGGVFRGDGSPGSLVAIARTGDPLPSGGRLDRTGFGLPNLTPIINNAGTVAFFAKIDTDNDYSGAHQSAGFFTSNGTGSITEIVREGQSSPDGNGVFEDVVFEGVQGSFLALNDVGQVAFIATLENTAGGLADDRGIFFFDPIDGLQVAIREGDSLLGSTITGLNFEQNASTGDGWSGLNNAGQIAFHFQLADGRAGLAVYTVPEPAALGGIGLTCLALRRARKK